MKKTAKRSYVNTCFLELKKKHARQRFLKAYFLERMHLLRMIEQHSQGEVRQDVIRYFLSQSENLWLIDEAFSFFKYIKQPANIHSIQYSNGNPPTEILVQEKVAMFADKVLWVNFVSPSVDNFCTANKPKYNNIYKPVRNQVQAVFSGKQNIIPNNFVPHKCYYHVYVILNDHNMQTECAAVYTQIGKEMCKIFTLENSFRCLVQFYKTPRFYCINYISYSDLLASAKKRNNFLQALVE